MFEALYEAHINIMMISTSEIKVSVLIDKEDTDGLLRRSTQSFLRNHRKKQWACRMESGGVPIFCVLFPGKTEETAKKEGYFP